MYYLRKKSHEATLPEVIKTNGTVIPERKYMKEERAIYKHKRFSRFYRKPYPDCGEKDLELYKVKKLRVIMELRKEMYDYCGEWFDVYDEDVKIKM